MTTVVDTGARQAAPPTPITVNGKTIPRSAIVREIQYHPASSASSSWQAAARALVVRELLREEAERLGVVAEPAVDDRGRRETVEEAMLRALIEREVNVPEPMTEELHRYYAANRDRFAVPVIVEARHILIAARVDDAASYAAARGRAEAIAIELAVEPGRFDDLARRHSACASAGEGGWLGQLTEGETTPEFAAAVAELAENETTSRPVATRYGFHIIRLERRIEGRIMPFESAAGLVADYLKERASRTAVAQYVARLVSRSAISGIDMAGAEEHRVH
jgi:peptidyl-prolyl cis-trans isomerase C